MLEDTNTRKLLTVWKTNGKYLIELLAMAYLKPCSGHDTKSHLMVRLQGMLNVPSLLLLYGPLRNLVPVRVPSMGQIELFNHLQMIIIIIIIIIIICISSSSSICSCY